MDDDIYKIIELMGNRMTDISESYKILNDNHVNLERGFIQLKTKIETTVSIIKWFITPSIAVLLLSEILKIVGVVK